MPKYYKWTLHSKEIVQKYFEALTIPLVSEERTQLAMLRKLYSSRETTEHMTWHATHQTDEGSICHPFDAEAWKHFDWMYPDFAEELCNIRLGLCIDSFVPHIIPGLSNPKRLIDVYLEPLIEELLQLWHVGVRTYDHATNKVFIMQAVLMWTMNDIPAYGDHLLDRVANISPAVEIPLSLPDGYVMDIKEKMKDNMIARGDLKFICNCLELKLDERRLKVMPIAIYTLAKEQKRRVCEWICGLKFFDGYASNLARCIDMTELWMHGIKNHDCHVFMQKLIPVAFREMLFEHVWSALIEVSILFQSICSTTLDIHKLRELENNVAIILCNLKKIFLPAFSDSMVHLIIHLPYKARVGEPVQYRWMYSFERFLRELKKKVKNKAHAEASIVEIYIVEKIVLFTSRDFEPDVQSK
ncbi:UNVERIFIED_CONTAM: hypothetical protein Sangu_0997200 [Sesamum angustifolium]|uniref:DUF4218 domain-containing protein n=1 Tax=Sesamum angustifolium TaxID=2727405 RepID=A0AAW2PH45_9LAMI